MGLRPAAAGFPNRDPFLAFSGGGLVQRQPIGIQMEGRIQKFVEGYRLSHVTVSTEVVALTRSSSSLEGVKTTTGKCRVRKILANDLFY
jgi:hypothetical protein